MKSVNRTNLPRAFFKTSGVKKSILQLCLIILPCFCVLAWAEDGSGAGPETTKQEAQSKKDPSEFRLEDIFSIEYAASPIVANKGDEVFFTRRFMDIYSDKSRSNIWAVSTKNKALRPITSGNHSDYSPALSPDGERLAFVSTRTGKAQIHMHWIDSGASAKLTNLTSSPSDLTWSPDGKWLAFKKFVKSAPNSPVSLPGKPEGAKWAENASVYDGVFYRFDGGGYAKPGFTHIFVVSADGGAPRQITQGDFNHSGAIDWSRDSKALYFSANRNEDYEFKPLDSNLYRIDVNTRQLAQLTSSNGPEEDVAVSPKGDKIAYLSFEDKLTNYENSMLFVAEADGSKPRNLSADLDRSIGSIAWAPNGRGVYISYNDRGKTVLALQSLSGSRKIISDELGGLSLGRPYTGASFAVGEDGTLAFTHSSPQRPAEIAVARGSKVEVLTRLSDAALGHKKLGRVEEILAKSSADQREIQGWLVYPPDFDPAKKYPLLLEIHGGPVAAYGPHFSAEVQLFAAAGYVVLYTNPRGSESYGKEFAQTIHHNYPSQDYDDLMSSVDAVIAKGFIDEDALFVTGGSGGGVLTAWIVGHTDRFAAAVVAKPVINWYSFVLTADFYPYFYRYWFGKKPWEDTETYMRRSPISYVGNVKTPTMLLTGEDDYRTPISETEQFYQALKIQQVESAMVRIPGAGHGISARPSNLMSKVAHILWWFDKYRPDKNEVAD